MVEPIYLSYSKADPDHLKAANIDLILPNRVTALFYKIRLPKFLIITLPGMAPKGKFLVI